MIGVHADQVPRVSARSDTGPVEDAAESKG